MVFAHVAVFEAYTRIGDLGVYGTEYLASCITLVAQGRVPAGKKYNVMQIAKYVFACTDMSKSFKDRLRHHAL